MAVMTIWNRKEINILRKYYPDMGVLVKLLNKSAYKINKKVAELGLTTGNSDQLAVNKGARGGDHHRLKGEGCLYNPKRRSVKDIERDLAQMERCIATGVDMEHWSGLVNKYNALQYEYSRALESEGSGETKRKNKINA
ncbi:hypothetical protein [Dysgonomonas termitidis]|uniref:Four helix bundle protein n=1 Tax=Dysgonomonas termitidis TaxID=1516126 RepID=A0ABV9KUB1_9BACT